MFLEASAFLSDFFSEWLGLYIGWFLLYWILGGVVFSILAIIRVDRIRRARFGCLFSFATLGISLISAWSGILISSQHLIGCEIQTTTSLNLLREVETWLQKFSCAIVPLSLTFIGGFFLLFLVGAFFLILSRHQELTWIEPSSEDQDEGDE